MWAIATLRVEKTEWWLSTELNVKITTLPLAKVTSTVSDRGSDGILLKRYSNSYWRQFCSGSELDRRASLALSRTRQDIAPVGLTWKPLQDFLPAGIIWIRFRWPTYGYQTGTPRLERSRSNSLAVENWTASNPAAWAASMFSGLSSVKKISLGSTPAFSTATL